MQFRIRNDIFLAGCLMMAMPMTSEAFVPSSVPRSKAVSTQLFYTIPDVTNMKAAEMRQELESYGINTQTLLPRKASSKKSKRNIEALSLGLSPVWQPNKT